MKGSTMTAPPNGTASQYEQAQIDEWSRYVAIVPIDFYGTRAYNPGDPVPVSAVEGDVAWVRPEWVRTVDAEQGQTFEGSQTVPPPEPPTIDPAQIAAPPASAAAPPPEPPTDGSTITSSEG
jgi:hypothetical protein